MSRQQEEEEERELPWMLQSVEQFVYWLQWDLYEYIPKQLESEPPTPLMLDCADFSFYSTTPLCLNPGTIFGRGGVDFIVNPRALVVNAVWESLIYDNGGVLSGETGNYGDFPLIFAPLLVSDEFGEKMQTILQLRHETGLPLSLNTTIADLGEMTCPDLDVVTVDMCEYEQLGNNSMEYWEGLVGRERAMDLFIPRDRRDEGEDQDEDEDGDDNNMDVDIEKVHQLMESRMPYNGPFAADPPSKQLTPLHVAICVAAFSSYDDETQEPSDDETQGELAIKAIVNAYIVDLLANREDEMNPPIVCDSPNLRLADA